MFTKEQENTNMKKETSHDLKQIKDCFLQSRPKAGYLRWPAANSGNGGALF